MKRRRGVHIGCSGWHYKHWRGPFYPEKFPASKMLDYYTQRFDTVEINNSFYRLPSETALENWRESTPAGFCFAVKASRFLTHMKKLKDPEAGVETFFSRVEILGPKLGPVLFQLPPWWEVNVERLHLFLQALPKNNLYCFELRNHTWHIPEVYSVLKRHNAAFCIFEIAGFHTDVHLTADWTYVRLHGPGGAYQGSYDRATLARWAERIAGWRDELRAVYVYFDNDQAAYAVENALTLKKMAECAAG